MKIKEVSYQEIAHLKKAAAKDRVTLGEMANTRWFAGYQDGVIVAVGGLTMANGRARSRGMWVDGAWRRRGVAGALIDRHIAECRGRVAYVDAYAYYPSHYTAKGFQVVGKRTTAGATRVRLVLATRAKIVRRVAPELAAVPLPPPGSG
jgi:hypothetical protein